MRRTALVCVLVFFFSAARADSSQPFGTADSSSQAVEQFELGINYGLGVNEVASPMITVGSPFRTTIHFRTMTAILHGVLQRRNGQAYWLDLTIEEFYPGEAQNCRTFKNKLRLDQTEDLAALVYYSATLRRCK